MSPTPPTGLLPSEVKALRKAAGVDAEDFARGFGVSSNVVERWEELGVPSGPTALAIRLVAASMDFDFPDAEPDSSEPCAVCGAPASEMVKGLPVCRSCHRDPVKSMEALGFEITKTSNHVTGYQSFQVTLPSGREFGFSGRFLSEGMGTMLTKFFKDEPQIGQKSWDDAVYVQWIEPGLEALSDPPSRELVKALVAYGMLDVEHASVSMQHAPNWGTFDEEIILLCGLLASRRP